MILFVQKGKTLIFVLVASVLLTSMVVYFHKKIPDSVLTGAPTFEQVLPIIKNNNPITLDCEDLTIATNKPLHKVQVEKYEESVEINGASSIAKVFNIHPEQNKNLDAVLTLDYEETELNGLTEENLILYSSSDHGKTWEAHPNSVVDPITNSIHLDGIKHFSLWTAGNKITEYSTNETAIETNGDDINTSTSAQANNMESSSSAAVTCATSLTTLEQINGDGAGTPSSAAQSFTATVNGELLQVGGGIRKGFFTPTPDLTLKIYDGAGIGGTVLHTQTLIVDDYPTNGGILTLTELSSAVPVVSGGVYTMEYSSTGTFTVNAWNGALPDGDYADGIFYFAGAPGNANEDMQFQVDICEAVACTDPDNYADNCDFDGDGVLNIDDLDDDNDGVLDTAECPVTNAPSTAIFDWASGAVAVAGPLTLASTLTVGPDDLTVTATGNLESNNTSTIFQTGVTPVPPSANGLLRLYFNDDFPDAFFDTDKASLSFGADVVIDPKLYIWSDNASLEFEFNGPYTVLSDTDNDWQINSSTTGQFTTGGRILIQFSGKYSSIEITALFTGLHQLGVLPAVDAVAFNCDYDQDGICNTFDLDSDNDDCYDSYEASVTGATAMDSLAIMTSDTTGVGANGFANALETNGDGIYTGTYTYAQAIDSVSSCASHIAENDINQTPLDTPVDGNILINDENTGGGDLDVGQIDTDGDGTPDTSPTAGNPETITQGGSTVGTIIIDPETGEYLFTPASGYTGTLEIPYTACDEGMPPVCATAILSIEVIPELLTNGSNNPPIAQDDTNTAEQGGTAATPLLSNDSDPDGDVLTVTLATGLDMAGAAITLTGSLQNIYDATGTLAGQASIDANGNVTFVADVGFEGEVPVDYTLSDSNGGTDDATLVITVEPNDGNNTYANDDASTGLQGTNQAGNILNNDNDPEGEDQDVSSLFIDTNGDGVLTSVTPVAGVPINVYEDADGNGTPELVGTIAVNPEAGAFIFDPENDFIGTVDIPYIATDGLVTEEATLYITSLPFTTCGSGKIEYAMTNGVANTTGWQWDVVSIPPGDIPSTQMHGLHRSTEYCEFAGWRHYYNANETDKFLFSVEMGSNTTEIEYIDIRVAETPESRYDTIATDALFGMARDWHVKTVADAALTAPVNIRFYYVPAELKTILDGAIALSNTDASSMAPTAADIVWFKKNTYDPENDISPDGATLTDPEQGYTILTPEVAANLNGESETDNSTFGNGVNYIQFNGINDFSGGSAFIKITGVALPIELTSFTGRATDCDVQLNWSTATEENFSHYEVERSDDGRDYIMMKKVNGSEFSATERHYQFTDESTSATNYYRLKMVDLDGSSEYSKVVIVNTDCIAHDILVYPNPVSKGAGVLNIDFYGQDREAHFEITNMLGQVVRRLSFEGSSRALNAVQINISDLPAGSYRLQVVGNKDSNKFIIHE